MCEAHAGSPERARIWQVAAIVLRENGHSVVDDVSIGNDESRELIPGYRSIYQRDATALVGLGTGRKRLDEFTRRNWLSA
jgi:hypothetical protein